MRTLVLVSIVACGGAVRGAAQFAEPKPIAGHAIATWQVDPGNPQWGPTRTIWVRNDTTVPMIVREIFLSHCVNVARCDSLPIAKRVLVPGASEQVAVLQPVEPSMKFSFEVRADWYATMECTGTVVPEKADTSKDEFPPQPSRLIVPPWDNVPKVDRQASITAHFFVAATGKIDSVHLTGLQDLRYTERVRAVLMQYRLQPGRVGKCPAAGEATIHMQLGRPPR